MTSDDDSPTAFPQWSKLLYTDRTHPRLHGKTSAHSYLQHYRKMVYLVGISQNVKNKLMRMSLSILSDNASFLHTKD